MPKGRKGETRPADAIGNAVHAMRTATGEEGQEPETPAAGRLVGSHTEFLDEAAEALSSARRLCDAGYVNVEITDTTTGEWCDEASLEQAAGADGR